MKFHLLYSSNIKCGRRNIGYGYKDAGTDKENISAFSHKMCIILLTQNHDLNIEIFDKEKSCLNNSDQWLEKAFSVHTSDCGLVCKQIQQELFIGHYELTVKKKKKKKNMNWP